MFDTHAACSFGHEYQSETLNSNRINNKKMNVSCLFVTSKSEHIIVVDQDRDKRNRF